MIKRRVLIVDDLPIYREPIAAALEAEGYKTVTASDAKEALRAVESMQHFDLMIVDYSMPDITGLGFLERTKGYVHLAHTATIMLTSSAERDVVVKAHQLGVSDYILKSNFSIPTLLSKVRKTIEAKQSTIDVLGIGRS